MDVTMGDADLPTGGHPPEAGTATHTASNPYESDPTRVPKDDPFLAKSPNYGRYLPRDDDIFPEPRYTGFGDPSNTEYWNGILEKCDETTRIRDSGPGKREVHAMGGMIIKYKPCAAENSESGTCLFDENEREAMVAVSEALGERVHIPSIYFIGRVGNKDLLVQKRIPGVTLEVAWPYLSAKQKEGFKEQTRSVLQSLISISPPSSEEITESAYIYADCANARHQRRLQQLEYDLLFMDDSSEDFGFMHNDMVPSKIIVNEDQIVGIVGWNKSGWFGWERAKNVHRQVRVPDFGGSDFFRGSDFESVWADLYDIDIDRPSRTVKTEPSLPSLEKVPAEHPTPKKIADLKRGSISRASSSERSSPSAPSKSAAGANKRTNTSTAKKGTATRKPAAKKRKTSTLDQDSKDATPSAVRRSNTPASSRASRTPAPVPKSAVEEDEVEEEGEEDGDDGIFCICRKPDNHTWMIGCDGGCEDWFHGACVKINRADADLIDKYICPNCEEAGRGHTTWKPMCRLPSCRQPARLKLKELSKYCCDDHGREFMRMKAKDLKMPKSSSSTPSAGGRQGRGSSSTTAKRGRKGAQTEDSQDEAADDEDVDMEEGETEREELEDISSRGGVLTGPDLKAAVSGVSSAKEFRELGESDATPGHEETAKAREERQKEFWYPFEDQDDFYSQYPKFKEENDSLARRYDECCARLDLLDNREKFLVLVRQRVKVVLERLRKADPKGGWKDICGYDSRLAWSDEEFDEWTKTDAGKKALEENDLDALQATGADGDSVMTDAEDGANNSVDAIARGICTKKRCERHKQWAKVEQQNLALEKSSADDEWQKYEEDTNVYVKKESRLVACKKLEAEGKLPPEGLNNIPKEN